MQPIDNSDLAWLIIADFLLDQGKITESEELRDLVNNPETPEDWNYEFSTFACVGGSGGDAVGGFSGRSGVGGMRVATGVGGRCAGVGGRTFEFGVRGGVGSGG